MMLAKSHLCAAMSLQHSEAVDPCNSLKQRFKDMSAQRQHLANILDLSVPLTPLRAF
jgi:hypothetical protein